MFNFILQSANVISSQIYNNLERQHILDSRNEILKNRYESQKKNVEQFHIPYSDANRIEHDLKHCFSSLRGYLQNDKCSEALDYLDRLEVSVLRQIDFQLYVENEPINYLLNEKICAAKHKDINCQTIVSCFNPDISDIKLSMIIGNLLDNATEHAAGTYEKLVRINLVCRDSETIIRIENSIDRSVKEYNPQLKTTKPDKSFHGYGIPSVKQIVNEYGGRFHFGEEDGLIFFEVFLPSPPENENLVK